MLKKNFEQIFKRFKNYRTFYSKNCHHALKNMGFGSGIRDPGSGKNLFRIPDPGIKKAPDPGNRIRNADFCNVSVHGFELKTRELT
jgi:hypothetical protein